MFWLLAILALSGQPKDLHREGDADGFGNIKWGMSIAEAKATFPDLIEPERSELSDGSFRERLIQPVVMVGSVEMILSIQTQADSENITRVVLKLAPFVQHKAAALKFLTNNLIARYGPPTRGKEFRVWNLPSTAITLHWRSDSLEITYLSRTTQSPSKN